MRAVWLLGLGLMACGPSEAPVETTDDGPGPVVPELCDTDDTIDRGSETYVPAGWSRSYGEVLDEVLVERTGTVTWSDGGSGTATLTLARGPASSITWNDDDPDNEGCEAWFYYFGAPYTLSFTGDRVADLAGDATIDIRVDGSNVASALVLAYPAQTGGLEPLELDPTAWDAVDLNVVISALNGTYEADLSWAGTTSPGGDDTALFGNEGSEPGYGTVAF